MVTRSILPGIPDSKFVPAKAGKTKTSFVPASTIGIELAGKFVIVTVAPFVSWESDANNLSTYVPVVENVASVAGAVESVNATVPGPLTFVPRDVNAPPIGRLSSVTDPPRNAAVGECTANPGPVLTTGAWFALRTVISMGIEILTPPELS